MDSRTPTTDDPRRIPLPAAPAGPAGSIVLLGGRIFDGTGTPAFHGTLVIRRNKIEKILPPKSADWPKDARVIDVTGQTILPGLIDAHTHIDYIGSETPWYLEGPLFH
jgi:imidazolonepropionase-like amidohydrolase